MIRPPNDPNALTMGDLRNLVMGVRVVEATILTIPGPEDWSQVRSPGRAVRRRRQGHRQNIRQTRLPDPSLYKGPDGALYGHPDTVAKLKAALENPNGRT